MLRLGPCCVAGLFRAFRAFRLAGFSLAGFPQSGRQRGDNGLVWLSWVSGELPELDISNV